MLRVQHSEEVLGKRPRLKKKLHPHVAPAAAIFQQSFASMFVYVKKQNPNLRHKPPFSVVTNPFETASFAKKRVGGSRGRQRERGGGGGGRGRRERGGEGEREGVTERGGRERGGGERGGRERERERDRQTDRQTNSLPARERKRE